MPPSFRPSRRPLRRRRQILLSLHRDARATAARCSLALLGALCGAPHAWSQTATSPAAPDTAPAVAPGTAPVQSNAPDSPAKWQIELGAGASFASGNSETSSFNFSGEARRKSFSDLWILRGQALYTKDRETTTAERFGAGTRYDTDLSERWFAFGQADWLRDIPANLARRLSLSVGNGYHIIRGDERSWDVFGGLGYTADRYDKATVVKDELRSEYSRPELVLGEESRHRLTDTTSLRQKATLFPNLRAAGDYRAEFEGGLAVAMTKAMSLTATLTVRYDSDPGLNIKKTDTLFVTGISVKLD